MNTSTDTTSAASGVVTSPAAALPGDAATAPAARTGDPGGAPSATLRGASPLRAAAAPSTAITAAADPLAELRGIHLPQPVGLWPLAPGWWGLAAVLVAGACTSALLVRRRQRSVVRHALRELDGLARTQDTDLQTLATTLSALIRRVALLRFGRKQVAALHGRDWQVFLAETAPKRRRRRARFVEDARLVLSLAPYAPAGATCLTRDGRTIDRGTLITATRAWIEENA